MATEFVAIELSLRGQDGVYNDLQKLDSMLQGFSGAKGKRTIEIDLGRSQQKLLELKGEINDVTESLDKLKRKRRELRNERKDYEKGSEEYKEIGEEIEKTTKKIDAASDHLKELNTEYKDFTQRVNELRYALKNFSQLSFGQMFKQMSTGIKHAGQNLQTLGNALQRIGAPFQRFTSGMIMGAGYKALNLVTEGFSNAFSRYDTMRKYELIMASYEKANYSAADSKRILDESVQGLPTALDEIMSVAQRFTATTGDIEKGTKAAIAVNNAFLASMSTDTQRYQGMMQLQDVLGGKKMNAREWQALANSMMPAIRKMGEALGYEGEELNEYVAMVQQGKVANEDFIDALINAGYGKDSVLGQIAEYSKQTWQALASNTKIAFARMGEGILSALDEVAKGYNGKTLIQNLLEEKGVIDQLSKSIQGWIKSHPGEIIDFFKQLKSIDFAGFARGMVDGFKSVAEGLKWFIGLFDGKGLRRLGWFMAIASPLGRAINTFGGLMKGLSHPIAAIIAAAAKLAIMTKGELGKGGGIFGAIAKALVGSGNAGNTLGKAEEAMESAGKAAPKMGKLSLGVSNFFKGWAEVATMIIGSAGVAWGSMKLLKGAVKSFGEMVDIIKGIDWDVGAEALLGMGTFFTAFGGLSALAGANIGATMELIFGAAGVGILTTMAAGFAALDMALIKSSFKSFRDSTKYLNEGIENVSEIGSVSDVGGAKTKVKNAITLFNQITELLKGSFDPNSYEFVGGLEKVPESSVKSLKNLKGVITNMKESVEALNDLAGIEFKAEDLNEIIPNMQDVMSALNTMILAIPSTLKKEETAEGIGYLGSSIGNVKKMFNSIVGENGILAQIPSIITQVNTLSRTNKLDSLKDTMSHLGEALSEAYNALNSGGIGNGNFAYTNLSNIREALKQARLAVHHMNELSGTEINMEGIGKIKELVSQLDQAFNDAQVESLKATISSFKQSVSAALQSFNDINSQTIEINPTIRLSSVFSQNVSGVIRTINEQKKRIQDAAKKPVTVIVPVNVTFTVTSNFGAALDRINAQKNALSSGAGSHYSAPIGPQLPPGGATGGRITRAGVLYRSGGGSVFKPRGVDKIPAMLSEGEYVQRKQATDFWGVDFMRKVNAMDVRGAMQAMLTKAGNATNIGRQSIFNNTVNNNQRITQNINTNNPSFARMQVGRFAGAL